MSKKDTYYFSHDANALTDPKILAMRCDYGLEGYGLYFAILEMLRNESNYKLSLNKNTYRSIKMLTQTNIDVEEFIKNCVHEYIGESGNGLLNANENEFWSESFLLRMKKYEELKEKRKAAGLKGLEKRWGNKDKKENDETEKKTKRTIAKPNNSIANAINFYSKCNSNAIANAIKVHSKSVAKNSKLNQIKLNKIKLKKKKSIHLSDQEKETESNVDFIDEMDKKRFDNIIHNLNIFETLKPKLFLEIQDILKEMYIDEKTQQIVEELTHQELLYALHNFQIANTKTKIQKPKAYFKKCILSAIEQTELSQQFDVDTIYEN